MYPHVKKFESASGFPESVEVTVIGGGIVGVCTAFFLAKRGVKVALVEKGGIAFEQSCRNWGWCRTMGRDVAEVPLALESLKLWSQWAESFGIDTGFRKSGIVYLCESEREIEQQEQWIAKARTYGARSRMIDRKELPNYLPGTDIHRWPAALLTESDGRAEPHLAGPAIAEGAHRLGAAILTRCAARGIETRAGRVTGVVTEKGEIACQAVVLAGGAWSSLFCRNLGIRLPQLKVLGSVLRTRPLPGGPEQAIGGAGYAFRKRVDGGYTIASRNANIASIVPDSFRFLGDFAPQLWATRHEYRLRLDKRFAEEWRLPQRWALDQTSPFERQRVLDPKPSHAVLEQACKAIKLRFPFLAELEVAQSWAGLIDVTPDAVPVIDEVESLPGFYLATGFSGHGFGIGPGAGHLMADLITSERPIVDPSPFRFARFSFF